MWSAAPSSRQACHGRSGGDLDKGAVSKPVFDIEQTCVSVIRLTVGNACRTMGYRKTSAVWKLLAEGAGASWSSRRGSSTVSAAVNPLGTLVRRFRRAH